MSAPGGTPEGTPEGTPQAEEIRDLTVTFMEGEGWLIGEKVRDAPSSTGIMVMAGETAVAKAAIEVLVADIAGKPKGIVDQVADIARRLVRGPERFGARVIRVAGFAAEPDGSITPIFQERTPEPWESDPHGEKHG